MHVIYGNDPGDEQPGSWNSSDTDELLNYLETLSPDEQQDEGSMQDHEGRPKPKADQELAKGPIDVGDKDNHPST